MEPVKWLYLFFLLNTGTCDDRLTIDYYVNLIKNETARAATYSLPQNSSAFKPKSNRISAYGTFDYIIIGAGSAGAVIANRLSELKHNQILLLEAGGYESNFSDIPGMVTYVENLEFNWNYNSIPQTTACLGKSSSYKFVKSAKTFLPSGASNRECTCSRGRGLGGTSIINYGFYVRGNRRDYNNWADQGNPGWSYKDVLPYFIKSENSEINGDEGYHGKGGYLNVEYHKPNSPQFDAFIQANMELGRKIVDFNGAEQVGVSPSQLSYIHGRRDSTGKAFLLPAMKRRNLKILTHSLAVKVLIKPLTKIAYGVLFSHGGQLLKAKAHKEVIIAAGTIGSPQLLMLSGIGQKSHLQSVDIPVVQSLAVGDNLQDHPTYFGLNFHTNYTEPLKPLEQHVKEYLNGFGLLTLSGNAQGVGFFLINTSKTTGNPDIEIIINPSNNINDIVCSSEQSCSTVIPSSSFSLILAKLHPKSRGTIRLKSRNPYEYPLIDLNYYSDPTGEDIEVMYQGIQMALELISTNALRKLNTTLSINPAPACQQEEYLSREFWYCQLRQLTSTMSHSSGTCKVGPDANKGAVVNHELKVHGIANLRVADASIMPNIIAGHTSAPAIMIGEKVSDMIKMGK